MTAKEVGIEGSTLLQNSCKVVLDSETPVSPAWSVLPMGCSWSLYFAQSVTETIASRAPALNGLSSLHDKAKDLVLGRHVGAQAYYVHVDNSGVITKTEQVTDIVLEQWKKLFTENGLSLHKSELSQKIKSSGVELDGLSLCCRVSSKRILTLRQALDEILRRRKITRCALEIAVGHIIFVLLGARPALCALHTCYRFMRAHFHVATRLWTETRAELVAVRGLLIFSQSEWTLAWNTRVYSTDSSLSGWRMSHADLPQDVVGRTRRVSERQRFISDGALAASRVVLDADQWIVEGADDENEETSFNIDPSFEEVSSGCLERCRWNVSSFGRWTRREDILVLEARAWMKCVERLSVGGGRCERAPETVESSS